MPHTQPKLVPIEEEAEIQPAEPPIQVINYDEAVAIVNQVGAFILDVRKPMELLTDGKLPNSINIPLDEIADNFSRDEQYFEAKYCRPKPLLDQVILVYCRTGPRSSKAAEILAGMGYRNIKILSGGIKAWKANGGKIEYCRRNLHFTGLP